MKDRQGISDAMWSGQDSEQRKGERELVCLH